MNRLPDHHPLYPVAMRLESAVASRDLDKLRLCLIGHQFPSLSREGEDPADVIWQCISRHMQPEPEWLDLLSDQLAAAQANVTQMLAQLVEQSMQMVANASAQHSTSAMQGFWQNQETYVFNLQRMASYMPATPSLFEALQGFEKQTSSLEFILAGRIPHALHAALVVQQTDNSLNLRWLGELDSACTQDPLLANRSTRAQILQAWRAILWSPDVLTTASSDPSAVMQNALNKVLVTDSIHASSLLQQMLELLPKVHGGQAHAWLSFFADPHLWPAQVQEIAHDLWPEDPSADLALQEPPLKINWWRLFSAKERIQIRHMLPQCDKQRWSEFWMAAHLQQPNNRTQLLAIQTKLSSLTTFNKGDKLNKVALKNLHSEDQAYERDDVAFDNAKEAPPTISIHQSFQRVQADLAHIERTLHKRQWRSAQTQSTQLIERQKSAQTHTNLLSKTAASLATLWQAHDRWQEAQAWWAQAKNFNPSDPVTYSGLADTLQAMGQVKEAETLYRQTVDAFPGDVVARNGLANTLQAMGQVKEAETLYRQTVDAFPGDVVARCGLADTLQAMGQVKEAETLYRQTVDAFPGNVVACNALANLQRKQGRLAEAKQTLKKSVGGNRVYDQVVWALIEASEHRFDDALKRLNLLAQQPMPFKEQEKLKRLVISMHLRAGQYTLAQEQTAQLIVKVKAQANSTDLLRMHVNLLNRQAQRLDAPESMTNHEVLFFKKLQTCAQDFQALAANDELYELEYDMLLAA